jgi:hypothetical protein
MLRQEALAFIKAISTLQLSSTLLKELSVARSSRRRMPVVSAGSSSTTHGGGFKAAERPSGQNAGKRKANELARSENSSQLANRRPATAAGSAPLPASALAVTGEQAPASSRKLGPPERGVTYAAVRVGPVAQIQPSGSLTPISMGSELSEPTVSSETANRRVSSDMFGPVGTT